MRLSVIVATRNRAPAITPCLHSIAEPLPMPRPSPLKSWLSITAQRTQHPPLSSNGPAPAPSLSGCCQNPHPELPAPKIGRSGWHKAN